MNKDLISIIIVNYNGKKYLKTCLSSIYQSDYKKYEIVFVDNGSIDGSIDFVKKNFTKKTKVIELKKNTGFTGGNIKGVKQSNGKYFLFLNNDTKISPTLLKDLVSFYKKTKKCGVVQPKIRLLRHKEYLDGTGSTLTATGFLQHHGHKKKDEEVNITKPTEIFAAKGACMFLSKKVYETIGGFDSRFFAYFEETDLCWRSILYGYKNYYYPRTEMFHIIGRTSSKMPLPIIEFHSFKNRIATLIKNLGYKKILFVLPIHLSICLLLSGFYLVLGKWKNSFQILNAILWNIKQLRQTIKVRQKVQQSRKISDTTMFKKYSTKPQLSLFAHTFKMYFLKRGKVK